MPNELSEKVYPDGTVVKLRDDTARDLIASLQTNRAYHINVGNVIGSNPNEVLGAAWDKLTIYGVPVLVNYQNYGQYMALMFKYNAAGDHGMAMAMKYDTTNVLTLSVNNGVKTYGDVASRVAANSFNSSEDITAHNSSSNPFICPKDGYVTLVLANGAKGAVWVGGRELLTVSSSQGRTVSPVFVKAGMSVYLTDTSGTKYLYYEPLKY